MKNNKKMPKKYVKVLSNIFLWTSHTDPWCDMLQTLERRRKYIGVILSDEHTPSERNNVHEGMLIMRTSYVHFPEHAREIWKLW